MQQTDLFLLFTRPLEQHGIPYMVGGSVAAMVYGEPRLTNDIDLVLDLSSDNAATLASAFPDTEFYCPPIDVIIVESNRRQRGHCNIIHHETGHKADLYFCGSDALQAWGMANRRDVALGEGASLFVAPPEYVILRKLEYYREGGSEKHPRDITAMLRISGDLVNKGFISEWAAKLGVGGDWQTIVNANT